MSRCSAAARRHRHRHPLTRAQGSCPLWLLQIESWDPPPQCRVHPDLPHVAPPAWGAPSCRRWGHPPSLPGGHACLWPVRLRQGTVAEPAGSDRRPALLLSRPGLSAPRFPHLVCGRRYHECRPVGLSRRWADLPHRERQAVPGTAVASSGHGHHTLQLTYPAPHAQCPMGPSTPQRQGCSEPCPALTPTPVPGPPLVPTVLRGVRCPCP